MGFLSADKKRLTLAAVAAVSLLGAGVALVHHFYIAANAGAVQEAHSVSIYRTPETQASAAHAPLGADANGLFGKSSKQDRADVAAPAAPKPAGPKAEAPQFLAAAMTPLEMGNLGPSRHAGASIIGQDVNRGGKGDRLPQPLVTVAKLASGAPAEAADDGASAEGVSAALFLMAPHVAAAEPDASTEQMSTQPTAATVPVAPAPPAKTTGWPELIKLARMGTGDGEDTGKTNIFGGLTEQEFRAREFRCMAIAIYFEARGEIIKGQIAVGQVIMNRLRSEYYPKTICGVVYQGQWSRNACQFSFACDGLPDVPKEKEEWETALKVAKDVISGKAYVEEIGDATHYHATYVNPPWKKLVKRVAKIGIHIFYKADFAPPLIASADYKKL